LTFHPWNPSTSQIVILSIKATKYLELEGVLIRERPQISKCTKEREEARL